MDAATAAEVLSIVAAYDNRNVTESAAVAWAEAIDDRVTFTDARQIVIEHYSRSREWIMPSDINAGSTALRRARLERMGTPEVPAEIDPDDIPAQLTWERTYRTAIADGCDREEAEARADQVCGITRTQIEAQRPVAALVDQAARSLPRMPKAG